MNALHTMIVSANAQAQPFLGSTATIGNNSNVPIIISQIKSRLDMAIEGYLDEADYEGIISTGDLAVAPVVNTKVAGPDGLNYLIRSVDAEPSAFVLKLKKIDP